MEWPAVLFLFLVTLCGVMDLLWMKVPNRFTVPLLLAGLAYRAWAGDWWGGLLGALVWFIVGAVLVAIGGMGGGDVKFMAAIGAWTGVYGGLLVFVAASLIGVLWAVVKLLRLGLLKQKLLYILYWLGFLFSGAKHPLIWEKTEEGETPKQAVPFAACLAAGVWAVTFVAWYMRHYAA